MNSVYTGYMPDATPSCVAIEEAERAAKQGNLETALHAYQRAIACLICENASGQILAFILVEQSRLLFKSPGGTGAALRSLQQATDILRDGKPTAEPQQWQWVLQFIVDLYLEQDCLDLAYEAQDHCIDLMSLWINSRVSCRIICRTYCRIICHIWLPRKPGRFRALATANAPLLVVR